MVSELSLELYAECRRVLLQCEEFSHPAWLRSLFSVEPLQPFRFGLPWASSPNELVDQCVAFLYKQHLSNGKPVLPVFLATLLTHYDPSHAQHEALRLLIKELNASMSVIQQPPASPAVLFDLLLRLNFNEQVRIAKQVLGAHQIAAFLVNGGPDCGQQILLNRLLRLSPGWDTANVISINVASNGIGKSSASLWRMLASKFDLPHDALPERIAGKVCQSWHSEDIVFVFQAVDYMPPWLLTEWLSDFWQPLVSMARSKSPLTNPRSRLLLFLVDFSGCVCDWDVPLVREPSRPEYPHHPLLLPPARHFDVHAIDVWFDFAAELLPTGLTADELINTTDGGLPQLIYEAICAHCGLNWEGGITSWLI